MAVNTSQNNLTRRDRNKLRHQREILDAALVVFAEKGYHEASLQEIADRADFAVSTIYGLFQNKEDLYHTICIELAKRTHEIFDAAMSQGENEYEKLVNFVRAKGEIFKDTPEGIRILENELHRERQGAENAEARGISVIYKRFMGKHR